MVDTQRIERDAERCRALLERQTGLEHAAAKVRDELGWAKVTSAAGLFLWIEVPWGVPAR